MFYGTLHLFSLFFIDTGVQSIGFGVGPLFFNILFSHLLEDWDAQTPPTGSGSDLVPAVDARTFLGVDLTPRDCFVVAVIPAAFCVLLAASIPDPRFVFLSILCRSLLILH